MNRNKLLGRILSGIREDMHELCKKFPLEAGFCFGALFLTVLFAIGTVLESKEISVLASVCALVFSLRFFEAVIRRWIRGGDNDADV